MKALFSLALMLAMVAVLSFSLPVHASGQDSKIESSAKQSYVFKTYLKDDDIKIKSKDGVVSLTGTVSEESRKILAAETVASLPGVKSVDNKLEVKGEKHPELSDAWLMAKVKTTLLYHRSVSGIKTEVEVKDGVVILRGDAENLAQKDLATEYAKDIEGVKKVKNEMTVTKAEKEISKEAKNMRTAGDKIDDASITAMVKTTLLYHRSTSGLQTKVETKNGVVTLSGKAKNAAEKDLATKFAKDVNGVEDVNNRMTIE